MKALILAALIALPGCSTFNAQRGVPLYSEINARVVLTDDIKDDRHGYASWDGSLCTIFIKRSQYPFCMAHELRHCFEHYWHDERPNDTDCHAQ